MKPLKFLIEKEFKQMLRNPVIPNLIVIYPIMVLLIFPWAIDFEIKNIRIDVVDHNKSSYSRELTAKVAASEYFILNSTPTDYERAMLNMEQGNADMILEIPATFSREIMKDGATGVGVAVNSVNGTLGLLGSNYISRIINDFSSDLRKELMYNVPMQNTPQRLSQINIIPQHRFNPELEYKYFMIPGFMALLLTIICGILPALNIVLEKETGTIQQINVTPVKKSWFILAKLIPYWVVGFIVLLISITAAFVIYRLWPAGSVVALLFSGIVFIVSVSGMGIIISNYSESMQQASFLVMFFILIIILLSGLFTSISSMPAWAQVIASINPFTYLTTILRMLYLNGSTMWDISTHLLKLLLFAVILNSWAIVSYRKRE